MVSTWCWLLFDHKKKEKEKEKKEQSKVRLITSFTFSSFFIHS